MRPCRVVFVSILAGAFFAAPGGADCVFVNMGSSPNAVQAFEVGADGSLASVPGSPFPTNGGNEGQALTIVGSRLYAVNTFSSGGGFSSGGLAGGSVSGFSIGIGCVLTSLPGSPWSTGGALPTGVIANPAGSRLFVSNSNDGTIMVFDIAGGGGLAAGDGGLTPVAGAPFTVEPTPADLAISPDGARLFVSQGTSGLGVYDIAGNGSLTAVAGSPFAAAGSPHFKGNKLTLSGGRFYASDSANGQVAGFTVGSGGALSALPSSPYATGFGPDDLALSPSAAFLFTANFDEGTVSAFAVAGDGSLAPVTGSPFAGNGPSGLALNPAGTSLYVVASTGSAIYQVDAYTVSSGGALTPLAGSPFAVDSRGLAARLVYFPQAALPPVIDVPALDGKGLAALAALLGLAATAILRQRRRGLSSPAAPGSLLR